MPLPVRRANKAKYDAVYRAANRARIKERKALHFQRTYNRDKAREQRRGRMRWHVEYCRKYYADPAKKAEKATYDQQRRDRMKYGEFAECAKLLRALWAEIKTQEPSWYERKKSQGKYYAINERRRHERAEERRRRTA